MLLKMCTCTIETKPQQQQQKMSKPTSNRPRTRQKKQTHRLNARLHSHTKENKQKIHKKNFFKDLNTLQKESKQPIFTQTQSHRNSQLEKEKTHIFLDAFLHEQEKPLLISEQTNKQKAKERNTSKESVKKFIPK